MVRVRRFVVKGGAMTDRIGSRAYLYIAAAGLTFIVAVMLYIGMPRSIEGRQAYQNLVSHFGLKNSSQQVLFAGKVDDYRVLVEVPESESSDGWQEVYMTPFRNSLKYPHYVRYRFHSAGETATLYYRMQQAGVQSYARNSPDDEWTRSFSDKTGLKFSKTTRKKLNKVAQLARQARDEIARESSSRIIDIDHFDK